MRALRSHMSLDELARYHRQMLLPGVGEAGQRRLAAAHAAIVGVGALGCASAELLCRAGVGFITLIDRDVVELTNLQRQCLFDEADAALATPKAHAAAARLAKINRSVAVTAHATDCSHRTAERLLGLDGAASARRADVIIDGSDNFETRYLLNDLSVKHGVPYVYGGAVGTTGMMTTFVPGRTPCLRCVFPDLPEPGVAPTCDTAGVLGPAVTIIAACQAADAMKVLLGRADLLSPTLLDFDLWTSRRRRVDLSSLGPSSACPCCGRREFDFLAGRAAADARSLCGRNSVQITPAEAFGDGGDEAPEVDLADVARRLAAHGEFQTTPFLVRGTLKTESNDAGEPYELTVFADGRAVIRGTSNPVLARSIYARYVGA